MSPPQAVVRGASEDGLLPARFSRLIEWTDKFATDGSRRAQVGHGSLWFLQRDNELSRWVDQSQDRQR
jgi:hypothetical protein